MTVTLKVSKRDQAPETLRKAGEVPAIVYGPKQEPIKLSVNGHLFEKTLHDAGEATIINLEGLDEPIEVLIHDVAFNAARGGVEHVDFYAIERGKELTTNVPLEFIGEAPAAKGGATVTKSVFELEVTCRPSNLPSNIEVDLSVLVDEDSQIKLSDLTIPAEVKVSAEPETVIATVAAAREEEPETTEATEVDMDAVEVEAKGKEESAEESSDSE